MKPLRLSIDEFGPCTDQQVIDFRELEAHGLFLIHGPSGSGKSCIMDAICYALHEESSGNDRGDSEMRSDFAEDDEPTAVTLDFRLGNRRYRYGGVREWSWQRSEGKD